MRTYAKSRVEYSFLIIKVCNLPGGLVLLDIKHAPFFKNLHIVGNRENLSPCRHLYYLAYIYVGARLHEYDVGLRDGFVDVGESPYFHFAAQYFAIGAIVERKLKRFVRLRGYHDDGLAVLFFVWPRGVLGKLDDTLDVARLCLLIVAYGMH